MANVCDKKGGLVFGVILILLGLGWMSSNMGWLAQNISWGPLIVIWVGLGALFMCMKK